jgi:hypothetical protein
MEHGFRLEADRSSMPVLLQESRIPLRILEMPLWSTFSMHPVGFGPYSWYGLSGSRGLMQKRWQLEWKCFAVSALAS